MTGDLSRCLLGEAMRKGGQTGMAVLTYDMRQRHSPQHSETTQLTTKNCSLVRGDTPLVSNVPLDAELQVRRLTPRECERLQGFPDDYTRIPLRGKPAEQCPNGPRYKAIGNSWAVPVVRWIGQRIHQAFEGDSNV